jgi:GntR family transcriptional regulator
MKLAVHIDKGNGIPVHIQFKEQIRLLVHQGVIRVGDAMPTVRSLAVELGINANTVARVYRDLQTEGLLRLERGVGTFVAAGAGPSIDKHVFDELEKKVQELVRVSKQAGLSAKELAQFIETRWQEEHHAEG